MRRITASRVNEERDSVICSSNAESPSKEAVPAKIALLYSYFFVWVYDAVVSAKFTEYQAYFP
jgi:hypothetical protein